MQRDTNAPPLNPLPSVVWALALPIIAMEVVVNLGARGLVGGPEAVGWRLDAMQRFAFSPDLMRQMIEQWTFPPDQVMRIVILLAIGKMVGEVFRWWAVLVVFFGAAIAGALAYTLIPGLRAPLIGGYPPVYGLIGGFTFLLWVNLAAVGANKYRAFSMIGFLLGIQLVFGLIFGGGWEWVADLSGFLAGFFLSFVVSPGGWERVRDKLRHR